MLNDYERPRLVADGSWVTIGYDSSLQEYNENTQYQIGDKINYDGHSYEAVKSVIGVVPTRVYYDYQDGRYISLSQAEWLCSALSTMPAGYNAIICAHQKVGTVVKKEGKFTYRGSGAGDFQSCQTGNIIADIISAFNSRGVINNTYELTKRGQNVGGDIINGFGYTLVYDFSAVDVSTKVKCCLTGHTHYDQVAEIDGISGVTPNITICTGGKNFQTGDTVNFGERSLDAFNVVSVDNNIGIKVMRVGQDILDTLEYRDKVTLNY